MDCAHGVILHGSSVSHAAPISLRFSVVDDRFLLSRLTQFAKKEVAPHQCDRKGPHPTSTPHPPLQRYVSASHWCAITYGLRVKFSRTCRSKRRSTIRSSTLNPPVMRCSMLVQMSRTARWLLCPCSVRYTREIRLSSESGRRSTRPAFSMRSSILDTVGGCTHMRSTICDCVNPSCRQSCHKNISCPAYNPISVNASLILPRCTRQIMLSKKLILSYSGL